MKIRDIKRGLWNIWYSFKATSFRKSGKPEVLPRTIWVALTYKCNSRCKMCGIWKKYRKNPELLKQELNFSEFKKFIDKNKFIKDITLSGGEPFLVQELEKMYLYLDSKGYHTGTATNAILKEQIIKREETLLKKLSGKNFHGLTISIDGLEKEHDRVRGVKGLFKNAVTLVKWGLKMEKKYKFFNINVSHTVTSHNYKQLDEFIRFFSSIGLKPNQITFRPAQTSPSYYGEIDQAELLDKKNDTLETVKTVVNKYPCFKKEWFYRNMLKYIKDPENFRIPCYAGVAFAYIDPYWEVYPCTNFSVSMGNLRNFDFDLSKLWKSEKAKKVRDLVKKDKCPNCWSNCAIISSRVSNPKLLINHYLGLKNDK